MSSEERGESSRICARVLSPYQTVQLTELLLSTENVTMCVRDCVSLLFILTNTSNIFTCLYFCNCWENKYIQYSNIFLFESEKKNNTTDDQVIWSYEEGLNYKKPLKKNCWEKYPCIYQIITINILVILYPCQKNNKSFKLIYMKKTSLLCLNNSWLYYIRFPK